MFNSIGVGEILIIGLNVIILCIPVLLVWMFFKALRKISNHSAQIELEVKALREEIQSMRENIPIGSPK